MSVLLRRHAILACSEAGVKQDQPMAHPDYGSIIIRDVLENNLKNVSLLVIKKITSIVASERRDTQAKILYPPDFGSREPCAAAERHGGRACDWAIGDNHHQTQ